MTSALQHTPVWPFLVGRGRREGYQTLLAPGFLIERDMHEMLSDAAASVPTGVIGRAKISCLGVGSLTLTYTTEAMPTGTSGRTDRVWDWIDEHGRPLEMLYGVVAHEPLSDTLTVGDLQPAREDALEAYRNFLAHEDDFSVGASQEYSLPPRAPSPRHRAADVSLVPEPAQPQSHPRPARRRPEDRRPPNRGRDVIAVIALAAVLVASALWLLGGGTTRDLKIIDATATPVNGRTCASATQLRLQASLTAGDHVRIRYRWLPASSLAAANSIREESVTVSGRPRTIADVRDASAGPYRLVIEGPDSKQSTPVTCRSAQVSARG